MGISIVAGIILYLILSIFLIYTLILNDASTSAVSHCLTISLPNKLIIIIRKLIGQKAVTKVEHASEYFLVTLYLVIVLGSWSIMFTFGYSFITKSNHVSNVHKYIGYVLFFICMGSWKKVNSTSPGYINAQNIVRFDNYPYDNLLFVEKLCPTVGINKLARSKYDRFTNRHVARFDHYCGWVHNTIGEENYRYFLIFLFTHVGMCIYGTVITWSLFVGEVQDKDLFNAIFFNGKTGHEVEADFWVVIHYMFMKHFELVVVLLLMGAMAFVLTLFLSFHLYMAANGMTTNELFKWREVKKWHKKEKCRYVRALKEGKVKSKSDGASSDNLNVNGMHNLNTDVDVGCVGPIKQDVKSEIDRNHHDVIITDPGLPPENIYNRGIVENFKEIIFPRSLRKDALMRHARSRQKVQTKSEASAVVTDSVKTKNI